MEHVRPNKQVVEPHQPALTAAAQRSAKAAASADIRDPGEANVMQQARLMRDEWRRARYSRLKPT